MPLETTASNPQPSLITLSALTALATSCIQDTALLNGSEGGFLSRRSYHLAAGKLSEVTSCID